MSGRLVRAPDQFRPSRDMPMAATPTCCCCCCCCIGTLVTSAVVLPMTVELLRRGADPQVVAPVSEAQVRGAKAVVGLSPFLALAAALVVGGRFDNFSLSLACGLGVLFAAGAYAFGMFGRPALAVATTTVIGASFAVEVVVGFFGVLATAGIGYLVYVALLMTLVVRAFQRRLQGPGGGPATGGGPPSSGYTPPPPPLPRPPSDS